MRSLIRRMLLLPSALLAASLSHVLAIDIEARDSTPAPISISPDGKWEGIDGSWSTFTLRVGTPPQYVQTFASWAVYQTWAVLPQGCQWAASYNSCAKSRGGIYNETASSTFKQKGIYGFSVETNLGYSDNGILGFDTVGPAGPGNNGPMLKHTVVGGYALTSFYVGIFGLNPKPTNFTNFSDQSPSWLTLLGEQKSIPSVSLSYTAGAPYRDNAVTASLTLGGYDTAKFVENSVTWTFAPDNSRDTVVAIQSISTPSQEDSNPIGTSLLPTPIYAYVDATVPQIWLPLEACKAFEKEFGLVYDPASQLYLVNNTLHQTLLDRNASVAFTLGKTLQGSENVIIELPYAAFDLTAKPPYQNVTSQSKYFPLRRAANDTQYTLGRAFFQEAYISIDYDSQTFNISQVNWDQSAKTNLVPILQDASSGSGNSGSSSTLSSGAIAGIAVGAAAVIILLAILFIFLFRRRHRAAKRAAKGEKLGSDSGSTREGVVTSNSDNTPPSGRGQQDLVYPKAELEGSLAQAPSPHDSNDPRLVHGGLGSASGSGSGTPRTPHHLSGSTFMTRFGNSSENSPITPNGEGTHSSAGSSSGHGGTISAVSPLFPYPPGIPRAEADSKERVLYEMPGDMPTLKEKDGKELSEKEALAHREKVYNGVLPPTPLETQQSTPREPRRQVNPEEVARVIGDVSPVDTREGLREVRNFSRHRAFSFEESRLDDPSTHDSEEDLYS